MKNSIFKLKIEKLFRGYITLFQYVYSSRTTPFLKVQLSIPGMILLLGLFGVVRNILEVGMGGPWEKAWFTFTPDIFFTMFFYPIFLCFFSAMLLHFLSNKLGLKINMREILAVLFFLQIVHIFIPFFDRLAFLYDIPFRFYPGTSAYIKMIFSPLALTPLILFFTWPTSLGIDIAWLFTTFILLKMYLKQFRFPVIKTVTVLAVTFYITYMLVYPVYFFFLNETLMGSNYAFGAVFMLSSIPSVIYAKYKLRKKL